MCGIAGIFDRTGRRATDRRLLARMTGSLTHRGPDGEGFHVENGVGLGHRRLAVIDLKTGDQPLYNHDRTVAIVFNGEIYNFRALVRELSDLGYRFQTHSDTEAIVHAWQEWGEACVERLRGMFAFAIWDSRRDTLFLARDRLGKKPLYYASLADGRLVFASELKALLCHPGLPREIDPQAVEDYFAYGYVPDPKTIYRGVAKLPPATVLRIERGAPLPPPRTYWRPAFPADLRGDETVLGEELVARLRDAIDIRGIADVPLGAFLSGGVDSSAVVALMAGLWPTPVDTFSIGFNQRGFDESAYAARVAERYSTNHHLRHVDGHDTDLVDRLAPIYDEPFGDSSAMPTLRVSAVAREQVTVALSGDGGDELFAGYRRYLWHHREERLRRRLPATLRRRLFGTLGRVYPQLDWAPRMLRARNTFAELALDSAEGYFVGVSVLGDEMRRALFSDPFKRRLNGYHAISVLKEHLAAADSDDPLLQAQYADLKTWLPGRMLTKVDRASMAVSLEVRSPFLDHELTEWAGRLPPSMKLSGTTGKYILKRAMEPFVPRDILYRPKMGFSVPLAAWFRDGPLSGRIRDTVASERMGDYGFFDLAFLDRLVERHQSGLRDHSAVLWSVLMFESFLRQVHEPVAAADLSGAYSAAASRRM